MHVLPVIVEFLAAYPEIKVRLIQGDRIAHLLDEHIDLAVRVGEPPDSRLAATRIGAIRRVVCAHPGYFSTHGLPNVPRDLADHRSEERRVGKECVSTCRSRWSTYP